MRHGKDGYKLRRDPAHRRALLRNLAASVVEKNRVTTTLAKAKAVQPIVEKMVGLGKSGTLADKRRALAFSTSGPRCRSCSTRWRRASWTVAAAIRASSAATSARATAPRRRSSSSSTTSSPQGKKQKDKAKTAKETKAKAKKAAKA